MPIMEFGKHKGADIQDIPQSYLEWLAENSKGGPTQQMCNDELRRRAGHSVSSKLPRDVWTGELAKLIDKIPDNLLNQTINYKNFSITIKVNNG
jgi:hypothetical protein